ncbi:hypothetical protein ACE6H2_017959 [Prunus campanulata]
MLCLLLECSDPEALAKKFLTAEQFKVAATPITEDCFDFEATRLECEGQIWSFLATQQLHQLHQLSDNGLLIVGAIGVVTELPEMSIFVLHIPNECLMIEAILSNWCGS